MKITETSVNLEMTVDEAKRVENLLRTVGNTRTLVAKERLAGTCARYPEITGASVQPLSDVHIIEQALVRELAHQTQVLSDLRGVRSRRSEEA